MKKFFTLAFALLCGMSMMADEYTDQLLLIRNGETIQEEEKTVTLTRLDNGQYTLTVENLIYEAAGMGIGNAVIDSIDAEPNPDVPGVIDLAVDKSIRITSGTASGYPVWIGPRIGACPIVLEGKLGGDKLYFKVNVDVTFYGTTFKGDFVFGTEQAVNEAATTAIRQTTTAAGASPVATYDLSGRQVMELQKGQVYVTRMSDGTVRKVLR